MQGIKQTVQQNVGDLQMRKACLRRRGVHVGQKDRQRQPCGDGIEGLPGRGNSPRGWDTKVLDVLEGRDAGLCDWGHWWAMYRVCWDKTKELNIWSVGLFQVSIGLWAPGFPARE